MPLEALKVAFYNTIVTTQMIILIALPSQWIASNFFIEIVNKWRIPFNQSSYTQVCISTHVPFQWANNPTFGTYYNPVVESQVLVSLIKSVNSILHK